MLHYLLGEIDENDKITESALWVSSLEDMMMTFLLTAQPHNYSTRFEAAARSAAPRQVDEVEAYVRAQPTHSFTIEDFVALTGVSGRSIYRAFQKHRGYAPMAFVRAARLKLARDRLSISEQGTTVSRIAQDCGFDHLGRFSVEYAKRYGESPSETLRRARRKSFP